MATIIDGDFKIIMTPSYSNWWTFDFELSYKDKPIINPEIIKNGKIDADEHTHNESFPDILDTISQAIDGREDDKNFYWRAWEDEVVIEIRSYMKNPENDGAFDLVVWVGEYDLVDGEVSYGFQNVGVKLFVDRTVLSCFYDDLRTEMMKVPGAPEIKTTEVDLQRKRRLFLELTKQRDAMLDDILPL